MPTTNHANLPYDTVVQQLATGYVPDDFFDVGMTQWISVDDGTPAWPSGPVCGYVTHMTVTAVDDVTGMVTVTENDGKARTYSPLKLAKAIEES